MSKKSKEESKKIKFDNTLPQNILLIGEHIEEDKNVYISQQVYKEIHEFTKDKLTNESGGMLIGGTVEEFGKTNIVIYGFIEAKYTEATPTTLKFTHETWDYVHKEIDEKYEDGKIVGWIHTHPDFGIFLSEYDKFIQNNFFNEEYQIAHVVDPIRHIEGVFCWINGKIEKSKGFYIYDEVGVDIEIPVEEDLLIEEETVSGGLSSKLSWILGALGILVIIEIIVFSVFCMNMLNRMKIIENQQDNLASSNSQSVSYLQQQVDYMAEEISALKTDVTALEEELSEVKNKIDKASDTDASVGTPSDAVDNSIDTDGDD